MRLKIAPIKVFCGENWKLASDDKWEQGDFDYITSYSEPFKGTRVIDGVEHAVFHLGTGDYGAQPKELCEKVLPEEPSLEKSPEREPLPYYRGDPPAHLFEHSIELEPDHDRPKMNFSNIKASKSRLKIINAKKPKPELDPKLKMKTKSGTKKQGFQL